MSQLIVTPWDGHFDNLYPSKKTSVTKLKIRLAQRLSQTNNQTGPVENDPKPPSSQAREKHVHDKFCLNYGKCSE